MRKISKKLLIGFIAIFVLSATAFAALTFSLADETVEETSGSVYDANGPSTIIDYIIENSNSADSKDQVYHVVEVGSSDTPSELKNLVSSGGFRDYVINGNKSEGYTSEMPESITIPAAGQSVDYVYFNGTEGNLKRIAADGTQTAVTSEEVEKAIKSADLCYLSNDPSGNGGVVFKKGNDITEGIKQALTVFAVGDHKPLIIDSHNLTQKYIGSTSNNMEKLATDEFNVYGSAKSTYWWPDDQSAGTFFDLTDMSATFLPVNGMKAKTETWTELNSSTYVARVLTIQNGSGDYALTTKMQENMDTSTEFVNPPDSKVPTFDMTHTYALTNSAKMYRAYLGRYGIPSAVKFETVDIGTAAGLTDLGDPTKYDLSKYDFVVIESGTKTVDFNGYDDAKAALLSAMNSNVHVLYSKSLINASGSSSTSEITANNFKYVYEKVATANDKPRFGFVLINTRLKMSSYAAATSGRGVRDIADIINAGTFRGIGGNSSGDSSNVYTALEIEPCYPINTTLASVFTDKNKSGGTMVREFTDPLSAYTRTSGGQITKKFSENGGDKRSGMTGSDRQGDAGFYYLRCDGVLDATSDEISYNNNTSLTDMLESGDYLGSLTQNNAANIVDYYNWSLSKAKVAHALGVTYDEVRVVHMSSAEFAASKDTLLDNYDMIYIGGDTSAINSDAYLNSPDKGYQFYRMYRHNGDTYDMFNLSDKVEVAGKKDGTVGVLTGNDITDDKLKELKEYVSKGMPVIFDKSVTKSYNAGTDIDPNSNMYDFLNFASGKAYSENNALWNFDNDYTIKLANIGGAYGPTFSGYVTLFAQNADPGYPDEKEEVLGVRSVKRTTVEDADTFLAANLQDGVVCETQLSKLIKNHKRPRLAVTSMPTKYIEGDKTTWLDDTNLVFNYTVNGQKSGKATLIVDDDSNGRFNEDDPHRDGSDGTVTYPLPKDYFGVVYWKLIVEGDNGTSASTTGVCKIKRKDQEKMVVDLLQIQPPMEAKENNKCTLLFCTECQQTRAILHGNRHASVGKYSHDAVQGLSSGFKDMSTGRFKEDATSKYTLADINAKLTADPYNTCDIPELSDKGNAINNYTKYNECSNNLGVHDHKFGIVKYFENYHLDDGNMTGLDDWTTNWFDEIKDDYVVNTTILTTREYESLCTLINSIYNGKSDKDKEKIVNEFQERKNEYKTYYKVMREIINGHDNTSTYTTTDHKTKYYIEADDWAKFVTYITHNPTDTIPGIGAYTEADLQDFKAASYNLDKYLLGNDGGVTNARLLQSKSKASEALCIHEVRYEAGYAKDGDTEKSIEPTERNYYDLYSLVDDFGDSGSVYDYFAGYSKLYQVWRNAKILEQYFKTQYVKYSLLSSVNDKPTGDAEDNVKNNYINLSDTFNCIVLGAADDFNDDDMTREACDGLYDYIEDGGNVILFHDTLTAYKSDSGKTPSKTMTKYLAAAFGQDARHLEYTDNTNQNVENILNVQIAGKSKKVVLGTKDEKAELTATAGTVKTKSQEVYLHVDYRNAVSHPNDSDKIVIDPSWETVNITYHFNNQDELRDSGNTEVTHTGNNSSAHDISVTVNFECQDHNPANLATDGRNCTGYKFYIDGAPYSGTVLGGTAFNIANGTMSGFTFGDVTISPYTGTDTNHAQSLVVTYVDSNGTPVENASIVVNNRTDGSSITKLTGVTGTATFDFLNNSSTVTNGTGVRAKNGYKNSEYFISPTLNGDTPNVNTFTLRTVFRNQQDKSGKVAPFKYIFFDGNCEDAEYLHHGAQDGRDAIHSGTRTVTDKTSQVNKGIVTMYPFTIGTSMKISNTTAQSYSLDIEDPNVTVYYTLAGGSSGSGSSMYAADPHNGQDNYFLYQYGAITYTGAGHSAITGYGRENNDERRLFINCIVNSARKSTVGPELELYDVDSDMSKHDDAGNRTGLWNDYVEPCTDGEADYKYSIEDISDQFDFSFLPKMAPGTSFDHVEIFFDLSRDGSNKNVFDDLGTTKDVKIFESGKTKDCDSDILTRITTGRGPTENRIGLNLSTPDPYLIKDSGTPNLVLKDTYFDTSKKAYVVVTVTDNKGNTATKTIKIEFKPELLELN